jgi:hypothetical protein
MRFWKKRPSIPTFPDIYDIPDDVCQAAITLMLGGGSPADGPFLACFSPYRVFTTKGPGRRHYLNTDNLEPQHIVGCWVGHESRWQPCDPAEFLAQRGQHHVWWTEFALRIPVVLPGESINEIIIVWQWFVQVIPSRRGGGGGTIHLIRTPEGWTKSDEMGEGWLI